MPISVVDALKKNGYLDNVANPVNPSYDIQNVRADAKPKQNFIGNVAGGVASIGGLIGGAVVDGIKGVPNLVAGTARNLGLDSRYNQIEASRKALEAEDMRTTQLYKAGKLTKDQFAKSQNDLQQKYLKLSSDSKKIGTDYYDAGDVAKDYVSAAALALPAARAAGVAAEGAGALAVVPGATRAAKAAEVVGGLGSAATSGPVSTVAKVLARNTLITQPTAQVATDLAQGKNVVTNAALLAAPFGISAIAKAAPKIGETLGTAFFGKEGFFGAVARNGGPDMLAHLDSLEGTAASGLKDTLRKVQQYNLDQYQGNARKAGTAFVEYLNKQGKSVDRLTPAELASNLKNWVAANEKIQDLQKAGRLFTGPGGRALEVPRAARLIAGRFNQDEAKQLIDRLDTAPEGAPRLELLQKLAQESPDWSKNPHVSEQIFEALGKDDWKKAIREVGTMRSLFVDGQAARLPGGYFPTLSNSARADFKAVDDTAELVRGKEANVVLGKIGALMDRAGVSPRENDGTGFMAYRKNLDAELSKIDGLDMNARELTRKLTQYRNTPGLKGVGIMDERQFTVGLLKDALGVNAPTAKRVQQSLIQAYNKTSLSETGLAGKVANSLYKVPGYRAYSRAQAAGRYELNPLFKLQTNVETELLSQLKSGGKDLNVPTAAIVDRIFTGGKKSAVLDNTVNILREKNLFKGAFRGSESASDSFSMLGDRLSNSQQRSIAGLVQTMAAKTGKPVGDFVDEMDAKTLDNIREIVEYPSRGFTSSNFAKTLNLVAFPSRYSIKLAGIMGKELSKQPPAVQIATLAGVSNLADFMNSDEGIKFQADNKEVLGIIGYLNPTMTLNGVFQAMQGRSVGVGDFGAIGGLPLGFVTQTLQDFGVAPRLNTPYLNPRTGEVVPDKVPANLSGSVKQVLTNLVNSMYSFPAGTFGFATTKNNLTQSLPGLKPEKGEFSSVTRTDLTSEQKRVQAVLKTGATNSANKTPRQTNISLPQRTLNIPKRTVVPVPPKSRRPKTFGVRPN